MKRRELSHLSSSNWILRAAGGTAVIALGMGIGLAAPTTEPTTMPSSGTSDAILQMIVPARSSQLAAATSQPATSSPLLLAQATPPANGAGAAGGPGFGGAAGGGRTRGVRGGGPGGGPGGGNAFSGGGGGRGGRIGGGPGGIGGARGGGGAIAAGINQDPFEIPIPPTRPMPSDYMAMTSRSIFLQGQPPRTYDPSNRPPIVTHPEDHFVYNGITTTNGVLEAKIMDNATGRLYSVRVGDPVCNGKVTAIADNNQLTYAAVGQRPVVVRMGSTLSGTSTYETVQPTYVPPTASAGSSAPMSPTELRMQEARQKELEQLGASSPTDGGAQDNSVDISGQDNSGTDDTGN